MPSKYEDQEVFIQYWYYEDVEESLRQVFEDEDVYEITSFLRENGKTKVLKRIYCFINLQTGVLEVYRGLDKKTEEIINLFSRVFKVKIKSLVLKPHELERIFRYAEEIKSATFKNIHSLKLEIMKGDKLEKNLKFKHHMKHFRNSLRSLTFIPKIRFLNKNKYAVYLDGDKGILGFSKTEVFRWRPRFEIRQIVKAIASCNGLLKEEF
jgi:hypothetical protein